MMTRHCHSERFMECCRRCPNFGATWACPPLRYDTGDLLGKYSFITLLIARISRMETSHISIAQTFDICNPIRNNLRQLVLELESQTDGMALMPAGRCDLCAQRCTRPRGLPCRHPDMVRPAPEALGLDVGGLTRDMAGIEIEWGRDGEMPATITLVAALLHNISGLKVSFP